MSSRGEPIPSKGRTIQAEADLQLTRATSASGQLRRRRRSPVTMTRQVWPESGPTFNGWVGVRRTLVLLSN